MRNSLMVIFKISSFVKINKNRLIIILRVKLEINFIGTMKNMENQLNSKVKLVCLHFLLSFVLL